MEGVAVLTCVSKSLSRSGDPQSCKVTKLEGKGKDHNFGVPTNSTFVRQLQLGAYDDGVRPLLSANIGQHTHARLNHVRGN